jgi:hypothetical protein
MRSAGALRSQFPRRKLAGPDRQRQYRHLAPDWNRGATRLPAILELHAGYQTATGFKPELIL